MKRRGLLVGLPGLAWLVPVWAKSALAEGGEAGGARPSGDGGAVGIAGPVGVAGEDGPVSNSRGFYDTLFPTPHVLTRGNTPVTVVDTTDETALFSYTLPANLLTGDHSIRLNVIAEVTNDTAGAVDSTFRLKIGATTIAEYVMTTGLADGTRNVPLEAFIASTGVAEQFGYIIITRVGVSLYMDKGTATEDETTELALELTVEMDTADADAIVRSYYYELTLY